VANEATDMRTAETWWFEGLLVAILERVNECDHAKLLKVGTAFAIVFHFTNLHRGIGRDQAWGMSTNRKASDLQTVKSFWAGGTTFTSMIPETNEYDRAQCF
jgi:hypothetical protein